MARDLAIDLGTANTLVYMKGRGIVLNEPSVIALNRQTGEVLATGHEAWQMIGRTPGYIVAVRPLRGGAITDFEITERMIRLLLQRVGVSRFTRPKVVICVPSAITEVERRAVTDAARRAGAADANLIEQPMAAAIGAAVAALVVIVVLTRGRRVPDGVASFQRQIDALSPEARRPVVKRLEDVTKRDDAADEWADGEDEPRAGGPHQGDTDGA